jgi:uncharacterized protein (TIGR02466 family)
MDLSVTYNDIFPTRIWQSDLSGMSDQYPSWVAAIEKMRKESPGTTQRSNRLGWMSREKDLLDHPAFKQLSTAIRVCCDAAFEQMRIKPKYTLESWVNIHERGGFNFQHMHDGALLSGSFYIQTPPGSGALVLRDPRPRSVGMFLPVGAANAITDLHLDPKPGQLVLFPYWLEHHVEPHESDITRVAISFNALKK